MPGRTRSLLLRLEVRPAGRRCECAHDRRHVIKKCDPRLAVRDSGAAAGEKGYCAACGDHMLNAAAAEIGRLRSALGAETP